MPTHLTTHCPQPSSPTLQKTPLVDRCLASAFGVRGAAGRPLTCSVVKVGAKLAYAAPLVAASIKLTTGGAAAVSGICARIGEVCGRFDAAADRCVVATRCCDAEVAPCVRAERDVCRCQD